MRKVFTFIIRFKELFAIAVIALLILLLHGCINANARGFKVKETDSVAKSVKVETHAAIDTMEVYYPIIEKAADIISGALPPDADDGLAGLSSIITTEVEGNTSLWMRNLGFSIRNIFDDNVLIIGMITNHIEGGQGNMIIGMFNIREGNAVNILDAGYRDAWYLMQPGDSFLELGSSSAACTICAEYRYLPTYTPPLVCDQYCFTGLDQSGDNVFYHSYFPSPDPAKSVKFDWTWQDWNNNEKELADQTIYIQLTPFETLRPVTASQDGDQVNFTTSTDVKDFNVWRLSDINYTDDGKLTYKKTSMGGCDRLKALDNFNVFMPFYGDTPMYAVSYVDMLGHEVWKTVMLSGMDGTVQLWDIP